MQPNVEEIKSMSRRRMKKIVNDPIKTAEAVNLVYVNDTQPGITRLRQGKHFSYFMNDVEITDPLEIKRIKSLVIPPAWENVWICALDKGHLQATGTDAKKRKQYKYHALWNSFRNHTKFYRLQDFGKTLPAIRQQLEKDISLQGMPLQKVLATVVSLMEQTNIRIGNNLYEKLYGSFGLTTLKDKHVEIKGSQLRFTFKGKKGVSHDITIRNKKLSRIVQQCRDIPGKELFQYYDEEGKRNCIDSGMVNDYIKSLCGFDFTAKDFRTWSGTVQAFIACRELGFAETETATKKKIVEVIDIVALRLGNTRTVCKKYYVHPAILQAYETRSLERYFKKIDEMEKNDPAHLSPEEQVVMNILEEYTIPLAA
jgi:DNA topoisomerase-1